MSLLSPSGTLSPKPFVIGALAVYLASFLSQMLLGAPVTMQAGLWPFTLVQIVLIWAWYVLHARRQHDAGRPSGMALGVAAIYTLMIVLLILVMAVLTASDTSNDSLKAGQGLMQLFAVLFFFSMLFGEFGGFSVVGYWVIGFVILMLTPVFVALVFSLWTATRPSAPAKP
jgi:uncharacterized membrane protein YhaH (DUF805 family)